MIGLVKNQTNKRAVSGDEALCWSVDLRRICSRQRIAAAMLIACICLVSRGGHRKWTV